MKIAKMALNNFAILRIRHATHVYKIVIAPNMKSAMKTSYVCKNAKLIMTVPQDFNALIINVENA